MDVYTDSPIFYTILFISEKFSMKHIFQLLCILMFLLHSTIIAQITWEDVSIPTTDNLTSIRFFSADEGFITISGQDSTYYTIDGGDTWQKQESIFCPDPSWVA